MRILITADLHYDIARSREPCRQLARRAMQAGGDAIVLVGDTAGADTDYLHQALELFAGFAGKKLFVAGNHCLWCRPGENSLDRYNHLLPAVTAEHDFAMLDHGPVVLGELGLVGSIGWYDYSFRDSSLAVPVGFYRAKLAPGAARYLGGHQELIDRHRRELTDRHMSMGARWMDGVNVKLPMSDEQFVDVLRARLREHLAQAAGPEHRPVAAFIHHLPFAQLVPRNRPDRFAFAAAYMGSDKLGEALLACPSLAHVYCGHSHWPARATIGQVNVVNIGSTYVEKRLEVLEVPACR